MLKSVKTQFPILQNHPRLVYLDSAATALKPQVMVEAVTQYYTRYSANIHRGLYNLALESDASYKDARQTIAKFLGAALADEIIFVSGTTGGLNLIASSLGKVVLKRGDEVLITEAEHHSNLVPWQIVCRQARANLRYLPVNELGEVATSLISHLTRKTKIFATFHVSNVLGTINPVADLVRRVKRANSDCLVVIDAAQSVPHLPVNVGELGCDFLVFSGHKLYGPTGIGVVWGKSDLLALLPPYQTGGGMVEKVALNRTTYQPHPAKFEAGTPPIAGAIGLGAAVKWLAQLGMTSVRKHEREITKYALEKLQEIRDIKIYGPTRAEDRGGLVAFNIFGIHPHDVAQVLADRQICVRAGHHCAMPLHAKLGVPGSVRASFGVYTTAADIDRLVEGLVAAKKKFKV